MVIAYGGAALRSASVREGGRAASYQPVDRGGSLCPPTLLASNGMGIFQSVPQ
jgi:hypothetical protein